MQDKKMYTQSDLLSDGWTKSLIAKFLPEPELHVNPYYKRGAPMKMWPKDVVESAMQSDSFAEAKAKSDRRKAAAKRSVVTKTVNLDQRIEQVLADLEIKVIPMDELRQRTLESKQAWYDYQAMMRDYDYCDRNAYDAGEPTVERWMVNYIRHNLTIYDHTLYDMSGKTGKDVVYYKLHDGIIQKISDAYPMLSDACRAQMLVPIPCHLE